MSETLRRALFGGAEMLPMGLALVVVALMAACANPGSGPDGGPYDETPPKILAMSPALGATEVTGRRFTITFDEIITIKNASEKVIVSPPQINQPDIRATGRRISVSLEDTLLPATTYTVDFSDAIEDNNEGNPLGQFTYYCSTGSSIDTMQVAGRVLDAATLDPVKGILVGLHADTCSSAFTTKPFDRVARTDNQGRFCVKGVREGTYRIYALQDRDGDFRLSSPSEMLAFSSELFTTTCFEDTRNDTLWADSTHIDTVRTVRFTHYLPDDVTLLAFTQRPDARHLLKTQRDVPEWFTVYFTAPSAQRPVCRGLDADLSTAFLEVASPGNDTITYWLRDTTLMQADTLRMAYTYEATDDSLGTRYLRTDTLELTPRETMARRRAAEAEARARFEKEREKRHKRGDFSRETMPVEPLQPAGGQAAKLSPMENVTFRFREPLTRVDTTALHLQLFLNDSTLAPARFELHGRADDPFAATVYGEWRPGQKYKLLADSAAFTGLSGKVSAATETIFSIGRSDEYGAIFLLLPEATEHTVVQLLQSEKKMVRQLRATDKRADFYYLAPGTYYVRAFEDRNDNDKWDPGVYAEGLQAEKVSYCPVAFELRANWDIEQSWQFSALPPERQKPEALRKTKNEEQKQTARNRNEQRKRERGSR